MRVLLVRFVHRIIRIMKTFPVSAAFVCGLIALLGLLSGCATGGRRVTDTTRTFHTVVIDPGHGGHDSGTTSRAGGAEKNAALDVALRLNEKLRAAGFHTVLTRDSDYFVPLDTRAGISNSQENAIFVSIHFNDSRSRDIHGVETYYNSSVAIPIAEKIEQSLSSLSENRGIHHANFHVLRKNRFPAVLVECGFFSNRSEASRCATSGYREAIAERIASAVETQRFGGSPMQQQAAFATTTR